MAAAVSDGCVIRSNMLVQLPFPQLATVWKVQRHSCLWPVDWRWNPDLIQFEMLNEDGQGTNVLGTPALDFLLRHPREILRDWPRVVLFLATIYEGSRSDGITVGRFVPCLVHDPERGIVSGQYLPLGAATKFPAPILKSAA